MECPLVVAMGCPQEVADTPMATPSDRPNRKQRMNITYPQGKPTPIFIKRTYEEHVMNELIMKKIPSGGGQSVAIGCPLKEEAVVPTGGGP